MYTIIGLLLVSVQAMSAAQGPAAGRKRPRVAPKGIPVKEITLSVGDIKQPRRELIETFKQAEFFQEEHTLGVAAIIFGKASEGQVRPEKAAFKAITKRIKNARSIIVLPYGHNDQQSTLLLHEAKEKMFVVLKK